MIRNNSPLCSSLPRPSLPLGLLLARLIASPTGGSGDDAPGSIGSYDSASPRLCKPLDPFLPCHWPVRWGSTTINTARQRSPTAGRCVSTGVREAFEVNRSEANEGLEEVVRVCAVLAGATG